MTSAYKESRARFRVWIVRTGGWRLRRWTDVPPSAEALEPAEPRPLARRAAYGFLQTFNSCMLARQEPLWAVALPITIAYVGDARPGETMAAERFTQPTDYFAQPAGE